MTDKKGYVPGARSNHAVTFYGLSTCIWCRKTRQFLEEQGVAFDYIYVDLLEGQEQEEAKRQVRQWNPAISFPTIVIDGTQCIVGYNPQKLKKALGL